MMKMKMYATTPVHDMASLSIVPIVTTFDTYRVLQSITIVEEMINTPSPSSVGINFKFLYISSTYFLKPLTYNSHKKDFVVSS